MLSRSGSRSCPRLGLHDACFLLTLLTPAVALLGCSEDNPLGRRALHGVVSYQGQPVDYGAIQFMPDDLQHGVSSGGMIEDGKYQLKLSQGRPAGSYQVMISSPDRGK